MVSEPVVRGRLDFYRGVEVAIGECKVCGLCREDYGELQGLILSVIKHRLSRGLALNYDGFIHEY